MQATDNTLKTGREWLKSFESLTRFDRTYHKNELLLRRSITQTGLILFDPTEYFIIKVYSCAKLMVADPCRLLSSSPTRWGKQLSRSELFLRSLLLFRKLRSSSSSGLKRIDVISLTFCLKPTTDLTQKLWGSTNFASVWKILLTQSGH